MHTIKYLADRLEEVLLSGTWIANTNCQTLLMATDYQQATRKIGDHNSISALTFHLNYYMAGLIKVLQGGPLDISDKYSFDMSPVTEEAQWVLLRQSFLDNAALFIEEVRALPEERLLQPFVNEKYGTYQRNIEGVIEHSYYHMGQISLIKKLTTKI